MSRTVGHVRVLLSGAATLLLCVLMIGGCENSPEDELLEGRQALTEGDAERAEKHLRAAQEADSDLVEARRMMASVKVLREDFEEAEEILDDLWEELKLDRERDLNSDQRRTRQLMNKQYTELYRQWAGSIDRSDEPESFSEVVERGLERNSRDGRLNSMLVDFYRQRADEYIEQNERIRAAEQLERIEDLHIFADTRRQARQEARQLRREAFFEEASTRFESDLRPNLMEGASYDPDSESIELSVEQPLDGRLDPDDDEAVDQARTMAVQTLMPTLSQFAVSLGDLEAESVDFYGVELPALRIVDEEFRPGHYDMVVVLQRDDLFDMAFEYAEYERLRPDDESRQQKEPEVGEIVIEDDRIELHTERAQPVQ